MDLIKISKCHCLVLLALAILATGSVSAVEQKTTSSSEDMAFMPLSVQHRQDTAMAAAEDGLHDNVPNDLLHSGLREAAKSELLPVCYVCKDEQTCFSPAKQQGTRFCKHGCKTVYGGKDRLQVLYKSCGNPRLDGGEALTPEDHALTGHPKGQSCAGYKDEIEDQPRGFVCFCTDSLCNNGENLPPTAGLKSGSLRIFQLPKMVSLLSLVNLAHWHLP